MIVNSGKGAVTAPHHLPGFALSLTPAPDTVFKDVSGVVGCTSGDKVACVKDANNDNVIFLQDSYSARPTLEQVDDKYVLRFTQGCCLPCVVPVNKGTKCFGLVCSVSPDSQDGSVLQASENACYLQPNNDIYVRGALGTPHINISYPNHFLLQKSEAGSWEYRVGGQDVTINSNTYEWEGLYLGGVPYTHSADFDLYGLVVCYHVSHIYLTSLETYLGNIYNKVTDA